MSRHVTKVRLLATLFLYAILKTRRILLIFLSMMRHGLFPCVMRFKIIRWEELKISIFICAWKINLFCRFFPLDDLQNLVILAWFTLAGLCIAGLVNLGICGWFSPSPKKGKKKKSLEIKCSYSFGAFKTFPEPCRTLAGRMRVDVEPICVFCNFTAIPQALHVQPSRRDKVATGEKAKAKAGCLAELFKA